MNDTEKNDGLVKVLVRFMKYNLRLVMVIIFFIGLISFASFGNKGIIQRFRIESEKKDLEKELESEIQKTSELQKEIDDLKTSDTKIEEVAREKYGMTKEGEKIYKVIIDSTK